MAVSKQQLKLAYWLQAEKKVFWVPEMFFGYLCSTKEKKIENLRIHFMNDLVKKAHF